VDVVLVEGFKREKFIPKVCFSEGCEGCVISEPSRERVLEHILEQVEIERIERKLPGFNCGECGHRNCHEMASAIYEGADEFRNCRYWNPHAVVSVQVNGRDIYMGKFAQDILVNTLTGLLSSFKGVKDVSEVNIRYRKQK
jgi:molybdopterin-guanine dinucleotide biosynthesis protein B